MVGFTRLSVEKKSELQSQGTTQSDRGEHIIPSYDLYKYIHVHNHIHVYTHVHTLNKTALYSLAKVTEA